MKKKTGNRMKIPLAKPFFNRLEEQAVRDTLRSGWVTQGPRVKEFEELIEDYTEAEYAIATTSATTALFLSLYLLDIGPEDEVIVPSFSFIATTNVVVQVGAKPVFVDIDPNTYNIDPEKIEEKITSKTRAIIPVDQVGLPCSLGEILAIAKKHNLYVIEDAACALGSVYKDKKIGTFSDLTCFSFHPRKLITTGEGGMIVTNNRTFAQRARSLRDHGSSLPDLTRHTAKKIIFEKYKEVGFNFRMSDLEAAVGVEQMKKLPKLLNKRQILADHYTKSLQQSKYIMPPFVPKDCIPNWESYVVRLKENKKISRDELMQKLLDDGIATRRGVMAAHLEAPYRKMYKRLSLPVTETATKQTISLPIYYQMTKKEQGFVIERLYYYAG